jgi:hypothetical protein
MTWLHALHSNVCRSVNDLGEHHLGLALRTSRTLNGSERNDGRHGLRFCHNGSFQERECHTRDHRSCPAGRTPTKQVCPSGCPFAVQYCSVSENCFLLFSGFSLSLFPSIKIRRVISKKGPRGFRRRSKSGRKRPGGSDSGELSQIVFCR